MKSFSTFFSRTAFAFAAVGILGAGSTQAQDILGRTLVLPEPELIDTFDEPAYNLQLGPLDFAFSAGILGEYNDNIQLSPPGEEDSDFIIEPFATIDTIWQLTELNTLRFSLGLSYRKYIEHTEFDSESVLISPTSAISLRFYVGDFRITISDQFSYQEDPFDLVVLSDNAVYRRFENQAGIQVDWDMRVAVLTAGYTHYNLWAIDDEFESLERSIDTVFVQPTVQVTPTIAVGLNASVSWVDFEENIQSDGTNYLIGPFVEAEITQNTRARLEVGWQFFDFDGETLFGDDEEDSSNVYIRGEIHNDLNEYFSHRLAFSRSTEVGFGTNFFDTWRIDYAADIRLIRGVSLRPGIYYEDYDLSGDLGGDGYRIGINVGLAYQLTPSITLGFNYRYLKNEADETTAIDTTDYTQNVFQLSLAYTF